MAARLGGLVLVLGIAATGCSSGPDTICGNACSKLHQCGLAKITITTIKSYAYPEDCSDAPCDKTSECIARCVLDAGCPELNIVAPNGKLHACLASCSWFFQIPDGGL